MKVENGYDWRLEIGVWPHKRKILKVWTIKMGKGFRK